MASLPFLDNRPLLPHPDFALLSPSPPFSSKKFQTPPFPSILEKLNPTPFMKKGVSSVLNGFAKTSFFNC